MIRKAAAKTIVGENETCASACFLLFLAGKEKQVFQVARFGVHSAHPNRDKEDEDAASLALSALLAREYEKLGVPPAVIAKSVTTPPGEIYWLTSAFSAQTPRPAAPTMPAEPGLPPWIPE